MNDEFYEDEVIEGFYVPSMLKKAWGVQLDVLAETDAICRKHNIPYFADWGTLLAAIRHNGYIPWDDDLDISMRRKDYERFLHYAEKELPEGFKVMHFKNHPGHHFFVARIVGKPRICFEEDHLRRFHGFPYIAGIDLFVLDNACTDRNRERYKSKVAEFVLTVADNIADGNAEGNEVEEMLSQCESYTGRRIDRSLAGEDLRVFMYGIVEELFASIPDEESDALVQMMPFGMYGNELYIPKEYYNETVRLPYMNTTMQVPLCYDAVMRRKFGNYMQIHKKWDGHDYPFFYGQHEQLLAVLDFEFPAYKAGPEDIVRPDRTGNDGEGPEDIVFLPFAAKHWKYMEKLYRHYAADSRYRVHVVPIPYYYKAWDGVLEKEVFAPEDYPADIPVEDYTQTDLERMHPAKIIIQNPFDEWNTVYSVKPQFYSKVIRQYTDELVYIPFFITDDFTKENGPEYRNTDHYVCMPGVINADTVILPTQQLKTVYIERLAEFVGSDDTNVIAALDGRIRVSPELVYKDDPVKMSEGGKTLIFFTTVSFLAENGKSGIDKINKTIDIFSESAGKLNVIWISQCVKGNEDKIDKGVASDFREAVKRFEKLGIGKYAEDPDGSEYDRLAESCDAYYGDPSALALRFVYAHKPVMIINANIR
ncbi:MAG: LicD family protein [Lachnospiraceae bacterium]|nr:LicD family protein [Lachnospiraceae bacterium]